MIAIDKRKVKTHFDRGLKSYADNAGVQKQVARRLTRELCRINSAPTDRIFEVGSGTGFLTSCLIENLPFESLMANDITSTAKQKILELETVYKKKIPFFEGDAEEIVFPQNLDALVSGSTIQWFKDLPGFFSKAAYSLNPEGILAFSTFGCDNFKEIKTITGIGLEYCSPEVLCMILSKEYNVLFCDEWTVEKTFENPLEVLRHMKETGVNGISNKPFGRRQLHEFAQSYKALFSNHKEEVFLTYNPIIIIAQKKK